MEENKTHNLTQFWTPEMEYIQIGYRLNHLIELLESMVLKEIDKRDDWWVRKYSNLLDTYESVTRERYKYLRDELTNTMERLNLKHPEKVQQYV